MFLGTVAATLQVYFWSVYGGPSPIPGSGSLPQEQCWDGQPGASSSMGCVEPKPYLIFGLGNAILRMNLDGKYQRRIISGAGKSALLDFHFNEENVYWADTHTGVISRAKLDGTNRQRILSSGRGISGLAVDWIDNSVFWSSQETGTIHRLDTNGENEKILLRHLSQPSNIVIDPNEKFIFWLSDAVTPSIQRSDVTGEMSTTVLKVPDKLETLSIDYKDNRLFWVQHSAGKHSAMGSCDYNGNAINVVNQQQRSQFLSVFLDYVYLTDTKSKSIKRLNKYTGGEVGNVNRKRMLRPPSDLKVVHPLNQPVTQPTHAPLPGCASQTGECVRVCSSQNPGFCFCQDGFTLSKQGDYCEDINECALWNHGCSLGCENIPGSYFCTCPDGYLLLPDTKTCQVAQPCVENGTLCDHACVHTLQGDMCLCPEGSILQPDGHSCTGCSSADRGGCSQMCHPSSPGRWECECHPGYQLQPDGKHCTAMGLPPVLLFANGVDIRQVNMDGTGSRKLVEEPKGAVMAVDYDPVQNRVYFASAKLRRIERAALNGDSRETLLSRLESPEGLALDWVNRKLYWTDKGLSAISRSSLNGLNMEVLIKKDVQKPRGIAVHPQAQKLFWTDMGSRPSIECSDLDGEDRVAVVRAGLVSPSGLAVDYSAQRLYWCDLSRGLVESAALDGTDRRTLIENEVGQPFDVAVFEDLLWVSDWEGHLLYRLDKTTGKNLERLQADAFRPAALVVLHPLAKPGADLCLHENGGCAQRCESRLGLVHCSCRSHYIQSADSKGCLPVNTSLTESDNGESRDHLSLKNKTLNDESTPLAMPGMASDEEGEAGEHGLFTEKMVSDQDDCYSLQCDVNARCSLGEGNAACLCLDGFTGDGELCMDIDECIAGLAECSSSRSECVNTAGGYFCQCRAGYSGDGHHCNDIDECQLGIHSCDVNAECLNTLGKYQCKCPGGYTGTGFRCQESQYTTPWPSTSSPLDVTSPWQHTNTVVSCPSSHDSYCMYEGICFYFPEMEAFACNCMSGYMGERCQFSDLEWWELQQAEQEKRRNVAIAVCMVLLVALLAIAACVTYCYGFRRFFRKHPSVDDVSESSVSEDCMSEMSAAGSPQFYVVLEHGACNDGKVLHVVGCQRRALCQSCSSETGDSMVSGESCTPHKDNHGFDSGTCDATKAAVHLKAINNLIFLDDPQPLNPTLI